MSEMAVKTAIPDLQFKGQYNTSFNSIRVIINKFTNTTEVMTRVNLTENWKVFLTTVTSPATSPE
jgi:hypothetical protein